MMRWTNDRWVSTQHRVVNPPVDATRPARRQSIAYFHNLRHLPNGLLAADHCVLMKRAVKGVARKHGLDVTFMAKPFRVLS